MRKYEYITFMKAFAMICVVLAHCMFFFSDNIFWPIRAEVPNNIVIFITNYFDYSLMSLFVFSSGFLLNAALNKKEKTTMELIISKAKRLLLPWLAYGLIWLVPLYTLFDIESYGREKGASLIDGYKNMLLGKFADVAWFLLLLFWISLIWILLRFLLKEDKQLLGFLVSVVLLVLMHTYMDNIDFYKISQVEQYLPLYFLGAVTYYYVEKIEALSVRTLCIISVALFLINITLSQFCVPIFYLGVVTEVFGAYSLLFIGILLLKSGIMDKIKDKNSYKFLVSHNMDIYLFQMPWVYIYFNILYPYVGKWPAVCITLNFIATILTIFIICLIIDFINKIKPNHHQAV